MKENERLKYLKKLLEINDRPVKIDFSVVRLPPILSAAGGSLTIDPHRMATGKRRITKIIFPVRNFY